MTAGALVPKWDGAAGFLMSDEQAPGTVEPSVGQDDVVSSAGTFFVEPDQAGQRLDKVMAQLATGHGLSLSRTRLQALILQGWVQVDGAVVADPSQKVGAGVELTLRLPPAADALPAPEHIPLNVVFEDGDLLVIDKPAGLVVHPAAGHESGTLVNALLAHCGDSLSGIGGMRRPGIVHRLDKDTTGLMVVAKSDRAHRGLASVFADHGRTGSLVREYLALAWNRPDRRSGTVDAPLGRHPTHREKVAARPAGKGRHALTRWHVEESFGRSAALLRCCLETGRTHQIRVHMAEIGHPLIGDPVYGTGFRTKALQLGEEARAAVESLDRQGLHAAVLGFEHPVSGATLRFESPLPPDMAGVVSRLRAGNAGLG